MRSFLWSIPFAAAIFGYAYQLFGGGEDFLRHQAGRKRTALPALDPYIWDPYIWEALVRCKAAKGFPIVKDFLSVELASGQVIKSCDH